MNDRMNAILASKRKERSRLAALPFSEKVALLEQMRDRALAIAASPLSLNYSQGLANPLILRERIGSDAPVHIEAGRTGRVTDRENRK